ncbi:MAG: hypothetical protein JRN20_04530 [Nitrososphaerota archaeon]|nr:hypothetical protein [Nitrososphaerota archaeon]MDG6924135.1 hypothetical protein [Nitrososphaerota archaeon]
MAKEKEGDEPLEEDYIHDIIFQQLQKLKSHAESVDDAIELNKDNVRKLTALIHARTKLQQQILMCSEVLRDPKLKLYTDSGKQRDFAKLVEAALIDENPAVKEMIDKSTSKE